MPEPGSEAVSPAKPKRWPRRLRRAAIAALLVSFIAAFLVKDYVRTLSSLRRVPGTNAYVMDYYLDYHLDKIRSRGMDVHQIEDSCLATLFPEFVLPIATRLKRVYLPQEIKTVEDEGPHCSTVALRAQNGNVFFGRNYDFGNDACLILRAHDAQGVASLAVIDLDFLHMNRADLDRTSLWERLPLLFAPYYVMDGINRHGVAVGMLSVPSGEPPADPSHPAIIEGTLERLILDYAHDADEAVELVRAFNVHFVVAPVHLAVADASGKFRIIEFLEGELRVTAAQRPWQVCTNSIVWEKSEEQRGQDSGRYRTASAEAEKLDGKVDFSAARQAIRSVSVATTMWTSVYDLTAREVGVIYRDRLDTEYHDVISRGIGREPTQAVTSPAGTTASP